MIGGAAESVTANYQTKRLSPTRYNYLPLWESFKEERKKEIVNEVVKKLIKEKPKLIMMSIIETPQFKFLIKDKEEWNKFLIENYEEDETSIEYYIIYKKL